MSLIFTYIVSVIMVQWLVYTFNHYSTIFDSHEFKKIMWLTYIPFANGILVVILIVSIIINRKFCKTKG